MAAIDDIEESERDDLGRKFFYLDHTAEVLENYRRIEENNIFDKVLHETRQKKAFLKNESRDINNLLSKPFEPVNLLLNPNSPETSLLDVKTHNFGVFEAPNA